MADHLRAVATSKTINIQITSDGNIRVVVQGFSKGLNEHVSEEYFEKTRYICKRYCPEVIVEA